MRSYAWITLLLLLVFGIGWTARLLAERAAPHPREDTAGWDGSWRGPSAERRGGHGGGPFGDTIERFAEELELTQDQLDAMDAIMQETMEEVRQHELEIWNAKQRTRPKILALLTDAQRQRLDELVAAHMAERREQQVSSTMEWLAERADLDRAASAAVRSILLEHEQAKEAFFHELSEQSTFPADLDVEVRLNEFRKARDEALQEHLDPDVVSQMGDRRRRHRR